MEVTTPKNEIDVEIGEAVRALIKASRYTQKEVAEGIGIAAPSLSQMLSGLRALPAERLNQIIAFLNLHDKKQITALYRMYQDKLQVTMPTREDVEDRIGFIKGLTDAEYATLVNATATGIDLNCCVMGDLGGLPAAYCDLVTDALFESSDFSDTEKVKFRNFIKSLKK